MIDLVHFSAIDNVDELYSAFYVTLYNILDVATNPKRSTCFYDLRLRDKYVMKFSKSEILMQYNTIHEIHKSKMKLESQL